MDGGDAGNRGGKEKAVEIEVVEGGGDGVDDVCRGGDGCGHWLVMGGL